MRGSLDELFAALRAEGVPIGPTEVVYTQHALATAPRLDRAGLRRFLGLLLIKRPEHQPTFERLFDLWCPDLPAADWLAALGQDTASAGVQGPARRGAPASPTGPPSHAGSGPASARTAPEPTTARRRRAPGPGTLAAAVAVALLAAWLLGRDWRERQPTAIDIIQQVTQAAPPRTAPDEETDLPSEPAPSIRFWQARITPADVALPPRLGWAGLAGLALLCALAAGLLTERHRRLGRVRPDRLPDTQGGPGWQPLPTAQGSDTRLTAARERRAMVWSIARFTAADQGRRVDERATARATAAAGGLAAVRYRPTKYPREVWLLRDTHTQAPELATLLDEVADGLRRGGLRVQIGSFAGTPNPVWWGPGDAASLAAEDGRRDQVLLAILTDGADLVRALRSPARQGPVARQLRNLALWPRVAVVDFSAGPALARALAPLRLPRIAPRDLPGWLGGRLAPSVTTSPARAPLTGDLLVWAGACALTADGIDEPGAQRLRTHLGLAVDPWRISDLRRDAGGDALTWPPADRRRLVNALLRVGTDPATGRLTPGAPAARAIDWWLARYAQARAEQRDRQNPLLPWADTEPERRWDLEAAILRLYRGPAEDWAEGADDPIARLLALAEQGLATEVRRHLTELCPSDLDPPPATPPWERLQPRRTQDSLQGPVAAQAAPTGSREDLHDDQTIRLPWRWQDHLDRPERLAALHRLGLGGPRLAQRLRFAPPTRPALALGALAGLALAAGLAAGYRALNPPEITLVATEAMLDHPTLQAQTLRLIDTRTDGTGTLVVGHPKAAEVLTGVPPGARVQVAWRWGEAADAPPNNPVAPYPGSRGLLFLGGTLAEPIRPCAPDWPARSLAVIAADPKAADARRLAIQLLDSGSADLVLIAQDWRTELRGLPQRHPLLDRRTQLLVLVADAAAAGAAPEWPGPWAVLATDYRRAARLIRDQGRTQTGGTDNADALTGVLDLAQVPGLQPVAQQGAVKLHLAPPRTTDPATGVTWVGLCPGTFTMGTAAIDPPEAVAMKDKDEQPAHRVSLSAFEIAQTETTNGQYRRVVPDANPGAADLLPAASVDWTQAAEACRKLGGDLPTEAQWEYAARAGDRGAWSFGSDAERLGRYAWYTDNAKTSAHAVGGKAPNRFGLHDMHGNLWEWARDWYGPYDAEAMLDPAGPAETTERWRVLRGGSFFFQPVDLRSARRGGVRPELRNQNFGFRCVRLPARQH